jgi:predicted acetyltransferase
VKLSLVKLDRKYKKHLNDMMEEWYSTGEKIIPYTIRRLDFRDFDRYMNYLEIKDNKDGLVPDSTFFCLDEERDIFVGAVNIRHYLNDSLLLNGGHIGDGVRPSERRKGIATKMIELALKECKKIGIDKVLMVCDKENIGSAKSIQNNGGILENEVIIDGIVEQRFWINIE